MIVIVIVIVVKVIERDLVKSNFLDHNIIIKRIHIHINITNSITSKSQ